MLKFLACVFAATVVLSIVAAVAIAINTLFHYYPLVAFAVLGVATILLLSFGFYLEIKDV